MDNAEEPVPKRRLLLGRFGCPAPPTAIADVSPRATAAESPTAPTIMQMLPGMIFKSRHGGKFAMPLTSSADSGAFMCFRKQGPPPGPPFHFAFPTIVDQCGDRHTSASFGFVGYTEFDACGLVAAATGTATCTPAPTFKLVNKNVYTTADTGSVVAESETRRITAAVLSPAWDGIELAKVALVVNSEAFFQTPRFDKVVMLAAADTKSFGINGPCMSISKTHTGVVSATHAAPQRPRVHSPALGRYVIVLNPPIDAGHGARVASVTGGTLTARGATTPLKLILEPAAAAMGTMKREVTLWTTDANAIFGSTPNYGAHVILLVQGTPSASNGVEFTVRAGVMAVDDKRMVSLTSEPLKSLFNSVAHEARVGGGTAMTYDCSIEGVLAEGRSVPIIARRCSFDDVIKVKRAELLKLVRTNMGACRAGACAAEAAIAALAKNISKEQLVAAVESVDEALARAGDFEAARENLSDVPDDASKAAEDDAMRAIAVLAFFESLDKPTAMSLNALVQRVPVSVADMADDAADEEYDADLCNGL